MEPLTLEEVLAQQGIKKTRAVNASRKGGYEENVTGKEIANISSTVGLEAPGDWKLRNIQSGSSNYIYEKCLIVARYRSYHGSDHYAHYHEEIFNWNCDQKFKDIVLKMWKQPDYDGYLSKEGEKLRLKLIGNDAKL
eukprot:182865_1